MKGVGRGLAFNLLFFVKKFFFDRCNSEVNCLLTSTFHNTRDYLLWISNRLLADTRQFIFS